jgi:hypothetical protein
MLKGLLYSSFAAATLAATTLAPSFVQAQPDCHRQKNEGRAIGTIIGGVGGALLGHALGSGGGKEGGAIIGGVGGAVAGNVVGGAAVNCSTRYGYYDDNGRWVPNTVSEQGYYDADGHWVTTPPGQPYGSAPGYAADNAYPPPAPPPPSYQDNAAPPPAYSADNGYPPAPPPGDYDRQAAYPADPWAGAPGDTREREDWLQSRIQRRIADGELSDRQGRHALRDLDNIRRMDADYRSADGHLDPDQRRDILARLDTVRANVWADRDQADARDHY